LFDDRTPPARTWLRDGGGTLIAASVRGSGVAQLHLSHGVDRIEAMGPNAVVIGADAHDLHFRAIELAGSRPKLGDEYRMEGASQGETRSPHSCSIATRFAKPAWWWKPLPGISGG